MIDEQAPTVPAQATQRPIGAQDDADFPGSINVGGGFFEGHYPGNKLEVFENASANTIGVSINKFFAEYPGAVVTGMWFSPPNENGYYAAFVLFTRLMSREEADGINKFSAEVKAKITAEKTKKAELEAEVNKRVAESAQKQADEVKKYVELGKRCEANHAKKLKVDE